MIIIMIIMIIIIIMNMSTAPNLIYLTQHYTARTARYTHTEEV